MNKIDHIPPKNISRLQSRRSIHCVQAFKIMSTLIIIMGPYHLDVSYADETFKLNCVLASIIIKAFIIS